MNKQTGGPAFPTPAHNLKNDGMTLRDYFAAKAMQITMQSYGSDWEINPFQQNTFLQWASERAYAMADAMLKAREE